VYAMTSSNASRTDSVQRQIFYSIRLERLLLRHCRPRSRQGASRVLANEPLQALRS